MKDIAMPQLDPEMKYGKVVEWLKREGDRITRGEPVVRIETEKISIDIESPVEGTLSRILVSPPMEVPVGTPLCMVAEEGGSSSEDQVGSHSVKASARNQFSRATSDVNKKIVTAQSEKTVGATGDEATTDTKQVKVVPLSSIRSKIADRMVQSWTQIPQVPLFVDVKLTEAEKFRTSLEKSTGKRVSFTAMVTKALANSLRVFPDINCRFENGEMHIFEDVDVSIAVALDSGLITPVVRNANKKTVSEISAEIEDLATRARAGKLAISEVRGGTTSVSNLGGFGVDTFIPIINPPQASILGVGQARRNGHNTPFVTLTLVFDHRVTDGARVAQLLKKIVDYFENPDLLLTD